MSNSLAILRPQNLGELMEFARMAAKSAMVPKDYIGKPENICLAIQMGSEIGLAPMQALQNIAVINGRPSVWGDAMLALCRASSHCDDIIERVEGEGDKMRAICIAKRVGKEPVQVSFSMLDAQRANLANKAGPWTQYPQRMLQMRARGFALRDAFPDVLKGLISAEEARDILHESFAGKTIDAENSPPAPAEDQPKKPTFKQWLDELERDLEDATDFDALGEVIGRPDVQAALNKLGHASLTLLEDLIDRAGKRVRAKLLPETQPEDDEIPF